MVYLLKQEPSLSHRLCGMVTFLKKVRAPANLTCSITRRAPLFPRNGAKIKLYKIEPTGVDQQAEYKLLESDKNAQA